MKRPKETTRRAVRISAFMAFVCITFAYGQKANIEQNPDYKTVVITPEIHNIELPNVELSIQYSPSSADGNLVYVPRKSNGNSTLLFIDRKSGKTIRRTSYNLNEYFISKRRSTDVDDDPETIAEPHFSVDGKHIVFKHLLSDDSYQIYSLNLINNELSRVEQELLSYKYISISPNGKYVAFVEGGDSKGHVYRSEIDRDYYTGPLKLFVVDIQGKNKQLVAQGNYINGALEWSQNNELYYGAEEHKFADPTGKINIPKLNVYSYNADNKKSILRIENGIMPHPSKSGERFVFFGPADAGDTVDWSQDWQSKPLAGVSLLASSQDEANRIALEPAGRSYPGINWLPDNTQFISLRETKYSPVAIAQVRLLNVETQDIRIITELKIKNSPEALKSSVYPEFNFISSESQIVLISTSEYLGFNSEEASINMKNSLYSIDIADGKTENELSAVNTLLLGYDVHLK